MKLESILNITGLNATFKVIRYDENRTHTEVANFNCIDEFGHSDVSKLNECIEKFGNKIVDKQVVGNNCITIYINR